MAIRVANYKLDQVGRDRAMQLPSGREIVYHNVVPGETLYDRKTKRRYKAIAFDDPRYGNRNGTYGGRLVENATQAIARDILAAALIRLQAAGYTPVGHVHDEVLVDLAGVDSPELCVEQIKSIMCEPLPWTTGLPIAAEGFYCGRYRKG